MTLLPCSLGYDVSRVLLQRARHWQHVLAESLDLLDLTGQLLGEGLLQRLQLIPLAVALVSARLVRLQWSCWSSSGGH